MQIVFFEVENWEQAILKEVFPEAKFVNEPLSIQNASLFADAEIISCFIHSSFSQKILQALPQLKAVMTRSTGFDHIDIEYCRSRNISVYNVPDYGSHTVAEYTFALILNLTRKIRESQQSFQATGKEREAMKGIDLCDKTLGVIGSGKIGQNVIKIADGFGMNVIVFDPYQNPLLAKLLNFRYVELEDLLKNSDIVTLHAPSTKDTYHLINRKNILNFKHGSFLINTARGDLIETKAIVDGIEKGILAGAGLDVLESEKSGLSQEDKYLANNPHVITTPHNAFNTKEALRRILDVTIENIQTYIKGSSKNNVVL